jgi:alpha-beta hydrolase superfamily lysophospholipase
MTPSIEETITSKDGTKLLMRSWSPSGQPRAVIALVHGFLAHSGLYEWSGSELAANGLAAYAVDLRGHGKSEGERLYAEDAHRFVEDIDALVTTARNRHPGVPVFLLGHSAGGLVSCLYTLEHQDELAGFICESFAYEVPARDVVLKLIKGLGRITPHLHVFKLKHDDFSRDREFTARFKADPLIPHEGYPARTIAELVRADERLSDELAKIKLPVLILHGTNDRVTKPHGSTVFAQRAGSTDKTLKLYDGHYHDLLNDIGKERVLGDITEWTFTHAAS